VVVIEGYDLACPLCRLAQDGDIKTRLHYADEKIIVVDCLICRLPMAVARAHRDYFTEEERVYALERLKQIIGSTPGGAAKLIAADHPLRSIPHLKESIAKVESDPLHRWIIDFEQRQIPHHPHCHLRPFPFPGTSHWEYLD